MIDGKQVKDASITIAKLSSGVLRPDVAVSWAVAQNAGSQVLTNLGAPVNPSDAARLQDIHVRPFKEVCRAATTVNIALTGTQTVDTVALVANDRCLVKNQTTPSQNGIYVVSAGAWSRAADADIAAELQGATVSVSEGSANVDKTFYQTADNITVGTTSLTWIQISGSTPAAFDATPNKNMTASVTAADFQSACATAITSTPAGDAYVRVSVNGIGVSVGDGVRTTECYFSADAGATAKSVANIAAGDTLFWVGSVALYQLAATDKIDFEYAI